jgi:hypothetical protein
MYLCSHKREAKHSCESWYRSIFLFLFSIETVFEGSGAVDHISSSRGTPPFKDNDNDNTNQGMDLNNATSLAGTGTPIGAGSRRRRSSLALAVLHQQSAEEKKRVNDKILKRSETTHEHLGGADGFKISEMDGKAEGEAGANEDVCGELAPKEASVKISSSRILGPALKDFEMDELQHDATVTIPVRSNTNGGKFKKAIQIERQRAANVNDMAVLEQHFTEEKKKVDDKIRKRLEKKRLTPSQQAGAEARDGEEAARPTNLINIQGSRNLHGGQIEIESLRNAMHIGRQRDEQAKELVVLHQQLAEEKKRVNDKILKRLETKQKRLGQQMVAESKAAEEEDCPMEFKVEHEHLGDADGFKLSEMDGVAEGEAGANEGVCGELTPKEASAKTQVQSNTYGGKFKKAIPIERQRTANAKVLTVREQHFTEEKKKADDKIRKRLKKKRLTPIQQAEAIRKRLGKKRRLKQGLQNKRPKNDEGKHLAW